MPPGPLTLFLLPRPTPGADLAWLHALPWPAATLAYAGQHAHRRDEVLLGRWLLAMAMELEQGRESSVAVLEELPQGGVRPAPGWHGSIAHAGGWLAAVASATMRCGVDIEKPRARDIAKLARHGFSAGDADAVLHAPAGQQEEHFYQCWTLREAALKAGLRDQVQGPPDALPLQEQANTASGQWGSLHWSVVCERACQVRVQVLATPPARPPHAPRTNPHARSAAAG